MVIKKYQNLCLVSRWEEKSDYRHIKLILTNVHCN